MIEAQAIIDQRLAGIDGLVMIYLAEEINGFWHPQHPRAEVVQYLFNSAKRLSIPIFLNHQRGLIDPDTAWLNKIRLIQGTNHINEFEFVNIARVIDEVIRKPRSGISLAFMGGLAVSCVRRHAWALCQQVEETSNPEKKLVPIIDPGIEDKFRYGRLIYELTEDREVSLFKS